MAMCLGLTGIIVTSRLAVGENAIYEWDLGVTNESNMNVDRYA